MHLRAFLKRPLQRQRVWISGHRQFGQALTGQRRRHRQPQQHPQRTARILAALIARRNHQIGLRRQALRRRHHLHMTAGSRAQSQQPLLVRRP